MDFKSVFNSSFNDIEGVCVAIGREHKRLNQQHIGLFYIDAKGDAKFLNLAWHSILRSESPSDKYIWSEIPLDRPNQIHLLTFCSLVYESNQAGIPYGIGIEGTGFDKGGAFTYEEPYAGLTCATFVMQVLHSQGYNIIDFEKWHHRKADKRWQIQIIQKLEEWGKKGRVSKEHIAYQRKMIQKGMARFKPEEIAAAAVLPDPPHGAEPLKKPSSQILNLVISHARKIAEK